MTPTSARRVAGAIGLLGLWYPAAQPAWGQGAPRESQAVAAVIRHVASGVISQRAIPTYVAYHGKTPPPSLWKLVSDVSGIRPMPSSWKPGADDSLIELFDIVDVRRTKSGKVEVGTQVVGPVGIAVEACTYTAQPLDDGWQVNVAATRCLVL